MKILVTGGAGFIGSHVVDQYVKSGHQVWVIDDLSSGKRSYLNSKAKFFQMDISDKAVSTIFKRCKFDLVNHHAAQKNLRFSVKEPVLDAEINILGSLRLLENCLKYKVRRFIFASTGGALYGDASTVPTSEIHSTHPVSPYGVAKLTVENYLHYYAHQHKIVYTALRYANVYGPRQDPKGEAGVVAIFVGGLLKGKPVFINGRGRQTRDFVYVGDVARANLLALNADFSAGFNVGTGVETSVNDLYKLIAQELGYKKVAGRKPQPAGEQLRSALDSRKIRVELGWQVQTLLTDGLKQTIEWFRV